MEKEKVWEILKELNSVCYICKKRISLFCGQPEIRIGGCCVGYNFKGTRWVTPRFAHLPCYLHYLHSKKIRLVKTTETEERTKNMLIKIFQNKIECDKSTLKNESIIRRRKYKKFRDEIREEIKKNQKILNWIKSNKLWGAK
jgi:hypothetical protein